MHDNTTRQLILFIGQHRVGSTALQAFLALNKKALLKQGILYPEVCPDSLDRRLRQVGRNLRSRLNREPVFRRLTLPEREPHNALAYRMLAEHEGKPGAVPFHGNVPSSNVMFREIHRQVERHNPCVLVLCAEVFSNFAFASNQLIKRLRNEFNGYRVQIFCTLRRIEEYLPSWYAQCISFGAKTAPLRGTGARQFRDTPHFDYYKLLSGWIEAFGDASVVLTDYANVLAVGGSIAHFRAKLGIAPDLELAEVGRVNESVPRAYLEFCRIANWKLEKREALSLQRRIIEFRRGGNLLETGTLEMLGPENRSWMYEQFQPINAGLGEIVGQTRFFLGEENMLKPTARSEADWFEPCRQNLLALLNRQSGQTTASLVNFIKNLDITEM